MKPKGKGRGTRVAKKERQKKTFKKAYLTKSQASRRLQITNAEFERLVILKGIYPREPKRFDGSSGKDKTYYFAKDILWLEREPILEKMREFSAFKKKVTRLRGRRAEFDAKVFEEKNKPTYHLDKVIKERYPTFADALRDLDDALSHIFLYASLPPRLHSESTIEGHTYLTSSMAEQCRDIRDRWMRYVSSSHSLRKTFVSIKGIYYEAQVKGETITWQCPYEFTSKPPKDVVYRVMISFLEFYLQLMKFVLFRLESDLRALNEKEADEHKVEGEVLAEDFPTTSKDDEARAERLKKFVSLFKGLTFFISRECPRMHISFLIRSFGGEVVDTPEGITHYVVDRPKLPEGEKKLTGVDYVQPQWLFDSINAKARLPADEYLMGKPLPPHISPFRISISNDPDEMAQLQALVAQDRRIDLDDIPDRVHQIRRMIDPSYSVSDPTANVHLSDDDVEDDDEELQRLAADAADSDEESVEESEKSEESVKEFIERSKGSRKKLLRKAESKADNKPTPKETVKKVKEAIAEKKRTRDTEDAATQKKRKLEEKIQREEAEKELKVAVMEPKKRKLYKAMQHGIKKRAKELTSLQEKREKIRAGKVKVTKKGTVEYSS